MKRILMMAVLTIAVSAFSLAQANAMQSAQSKNSKQEIVALSRAFVDESILTHKERAETIELTNMEVRINGNNAVFTSHADLKGTSPSGQNYTLPHRLRVEYTKQEGHWQFVRGQWRGIK